MREKIAAANFVAASTQGARCRELHRRPSRSRRLVILALFSHGDFLGVRKNSGAMLCCRFDASARCGERHRRPPRSRRRNGRQAPLKKRKPAGFLFCIFFLVFAFHFLPFPAKKRMPLCNLHGSGKGAVFHTFHRWICGKP